MVAGDEDARDPAQDCGTRPMSGVRRSSWFEPGYTPANRSPIGTEIRHHTGMMRKISNDPDRLKRWVYSHIFNWTEVNGPVPKGMKLTCLGDRWDTSASNWIAIPVGAMSDIHRVFPGGLATVPEEIRNAIVTSALLQHQLRERARSNPQTLPRTAAEAKQSNSRWFFTGVPCSNGHVAIRRTCNHGCHACSMEYRKTHARGRTRRLTDSRRPEDA